MDLREFRATVSWGAALMLGHPQDKILADNASFMLAPEVPEGSQGPRTNWNPPHFLRVPHVFPNPASLESQNQTNARWQRGGLLLRLTAIY